jgi:hypothetical protein
MTLNNFQLGPSDVPSYQLSGVPFATGSSGDTIPVSTGTPVRVAFPNPTRFFVIQNTSAHALRIGFTENGTKYPANLTANYFILSGNQNTGRMELRCKELFLLSDTAKKAGFTLLAGLTPVNFFPTLTGSAGYKGVG